MRINLHKYVYAYPFGLTGFTMEPVLIIFLFFKVHQSPLYGAAV